MKDTKYAQLVKNVADFLGGANMKKLDGEVDKLEALGYKYKRTSGYGEGVFVVSVKMVHDRFGEVSLSVPQSEDEGSIGRVEFIPFNDFKGLNNYEF